MATQRIFTTCTLLIIIVVGLRYEASVASHQTVRSSFATPRSTFLTYLEAIRKNNLKAAVACWVFDGDNRSEALDVLAGLWVSSREITLLAEKQFGRDGLHRILKGWRRDDVTDQAINLTKERVEKAVVTIAGDRAQMSIPWQEKDGYPNSAFMYGSEPLYFRQVDGRWNLDANKMTGLQNASDFFHEGSWGAMFRDQIVIMNEAIAAMKRGDFKTQREFALFIHEKFSIMTKRPFVKNQLPGDVVFIEDTKDHYVSLRIGEHGVCSSGGGTPSKTVAGITNLSSMNDSLHRICGTLHGGRNGGIVIESKIQDQYYDVVYHHNDRSALRTIAKPLGLRIVEEERDVSVIVMRQQSTGHKLVPGSQSKSTDAYYFQSNVTMDELAQFLEKNFSMPVVNLTRLDGKYDVPLSRESVRHSAWEEGKPFNLDDLGLVLQQEKQKLRVTVVKDNR